jgi:hypothetical protein
MNKYAAVVAGIIAAAFAGFSAPAIAHGGVDWSVTVHGQPQPPIYYQAPPPAVYYPQSPYVYGPPPSAFQSPPPIYQYREQHDQWQGQQYRDDRGQRSDGWREREGRHRDRDRDERQTRNRDQENRWPGANQDLPRWGYGDDRRR